MSEANLQSAVCDALRRIGCRVHENRVTISRNRATGAGKGSPDLIVGVPGVIPGWLAYVWMELKMPKTGRVSDAQHRFRADEEAAGGKVFVVRSVDEAIKVVTDLWRRAA